MRQTNFRPRASGRPNRAANLTENKRALSVREALIKEGQVCEQVKQLTAAASLGIEDDAPSKKRSRTGQIQKCSFCNQQGHKRGKCPDNPHRSVTRE